MARDAGSWRIAGVGQNELVAYPGLAQIVLPFAEDGAVVECLNSRIFYICGLERILAYRL